MTYQELDNFFPYLVFVYGFLVTFVLSSGPLMRLAEERLPLHLVNQLNGHRVLATVSLWVGAAWVLQNLWLA